MFRIRKTRIPMLTALESEIVALDFETTGVSEDHADEAWQIGMVKLRKGKVDPDSSFSSFLKVEPRTFPFHASASPRNVMDEITRASSLQALWPQLRSWWVGHPLAAHNVGVEKKIVTRTAPLHRIGPWIDTLKLIRCVYPDLVSHTLEDVVVQLDLTSRVRRVCPDRDFHDALFDAVGCAVVLEHLLGLAGWERMTVEVLTQAHPKKFYSMVKERSPRYMKG